MGVLTLANGQMQKIIDGKQEYEYGPKFRKMPCQGEMTKLTL